MESQVGNTKDVGFQFETQNGITRLVRVFNPFLSPVHPSQLQRYE